MEIISILLFVVFVFVAVNNDDDDEDDGDGGMEIVGLIIGNIFCIFWLTDFVIQSCIIPGTQLRNDCCGECCGCAATLTTKLVIDGIYLFFVILGAWILPILESLVEAEAMNLRLFRTGGLLIFVKLGMEIAVICLLRQEQNAPLQEALPPAVGTAVVGQPVVITVDQKKQEA